MSFALSSSSSPSPSGDQRRESNTQGTSSKPTHEYVVLYKPRDTLSTKGTDPSQSSRKTVYESLNEAGFGSHLGSVGRLDYETTGLYLFMDDPILNKALRDKNFDGIKDHDYYDKIHNQKKHLGEKRNIDIAANKNENSTGNFSNSLNDDPGGACTNNDTDDINNNKNNSTSNANVNNSKKDSNHVHDHFPNTKKTAITSVSTQARKQGVVKEYILTLGGKIGEHFTQERIDQLRMPLDMQMSGWDIRTDAAEVQVLGIWQRPESETSADCQRYDKGTRPDWMDMGQCTSNQLISKPAKGKRLKKQQTGASTQTWIPFDGWLTGVKVSIREGRNRQIRRLCTRSKLKLRHLHRERIGNITLNGLRPGEGRRLSQSEVDGLYALSCPRRMDNVPMALQIVEANNSTPTSTTSPVRE